MVEITINIPKDISDILGETSQALYVEAIKEVAAKRLTNVHKRLSDLKDEMSEYESKYSISYEDFIGNVPDTVEGHDDWIDWTYLVNVSTELSKKITKLQLLLDR